LNTIKLMKNIIKLRKTTSKNIWKVLEFKINNLVFTKDLFLNKFNLFWNTVNNQFSEDNHIFVLFKIKYTNMDYVTIGNLQRLNKNDKIWYFNWIIDMMKFKSEYYNETSIDSFIFSYGFKKGSAPNKENFKENVYLQNYKNNKLVISYNPLDHGKLIIKNNFNNYSQYILQTKEGNLIHFKQFDKYNEVEIFSNIGNIMVIYKDEWISENQFVRILDNKKFYFENNKEILFTKEMKTKFISKLSPTKNLKNKFITLDIETFIKENTLIPYLIRFYDGINCYSYWLGNYSSVEAMILDCFKDILIRKYNGSKVYIHNLAKFDIIFLLKYLVKLGSVQPIIHNGRIISIDLDFGKDCEYKITFKDSYLILLASLMKLCKSFNVENKKSIFPHLFVNENNLNYIGPVPDFKYFINVSKEDYLEYCKQFNNNWSLKNEAEKYCALDCISLHQVISRFAEMVFDLFGRNMHHYATLPSLAFAIFRAKFMKDEIIPQLSGKIAKDIRQSYTGGACDMYIPFNEEGVKLYAYDVNSLYPSVMKNSLMPVGTPTYFKGNIRAMDTNAFGFFYCKIIAPDNLKHPILQTHVKTSNGIRTIAPLGTWEDMLFSIEIDNALKYGYKFEILWGYTFKSEYIFKDYVDTLYSFRLNYPKSDPMNYLAKILLNSLYGRFGMDDNFSEINIIHKDYYADFENKFMDNITDIIDLGDYKLVTHNIAENLNDNDDSTHNVSVGIASAITAYARIHMSQFKNNPDFNLYYTDTDSVYTNKTLPEYLIDTKVLGKLKLESIVNKAIFLSPKVYCLETKDGTFIYKVKGLSHETELTLQDFKQLLYKDTFIEKFHRKWFRDLSKAQIQLLEQVYTLKVTDNKRELIYDKNNKLISTKPYKISGDKIIK
jgi:DNA polymerase type B, organellar and viral